MRILAISGSASKNGSNYQLLKAIKTLFKDEHSIDIVDYLSEFPLFTTERLKSGIPEKIKTYKTQLTEAEVVIISTPEYTHNIPAVLKNMIEWCTHSGEFSNKKIIPITFTPHEPRGEHAMKSLLFSLLALESNAITQLPLYKTDFHINEQQIELTEEVKELLRAAFEML
ncbi:NADPH-dependent FMN reductase [Brumimicrobium mesophilum]|uniref:NADPH-dependent FMN reductase n=1 Tax=Brumimicrobium mesophilum TaxID=392717 RepID=UPI000D141A91|nr:NADPH-dependent FMN reductase [Brumimicrobium mesophilum]